MFDRVHKLEKNIQTLKDKITHLGETEQTATVKCEEEKRELAILRERLVDLRHSYEEEVEKQAALHSALQEWNLSYHRTMGFMTELSGRYADLVRDRDNLIDDIGDLDKKVEAERSAIAGLQHQLRDATTERASLNDESATMAANLTEAEQGAAEEERAIAVYRLQLQEEMSTSAMLQSTIAMEDLKIEGLVTAGLAARASKAEIVAINTATAAAPTVATITATYDANMASSEAEDILDQYSPATPSTAAATGGGATVRTPGGELVAVPPSLGRQASIPEVLARRRSKLSRLQSVHTIQSSRQSMIANGVQLSERLETQKRRVMLALEAEHNEKKQLQTELDSERDKHMALKTEAEDHDTAMTAIQNQVDRLAAAEMALRRKIHEAQSMYLLFAKLPF
jgi:chromosome segregation ATPase